MKYKITWAFTYIQRGFKIKESLMEDNDGKGFTLDEVLEEVGKLDKLFNTIAVKIEKIDDIDITEDFKNGNDKK